MYAYIYIHMYRIIMYICLRAHTLNFFFWVKHDKQEPLVSSFFGFYRCSFVHVFCFLPLTALAQSHPLTWGLWDWLCMGLANMLIRVICWRLLYFANRKSTTCGIYIVFFSKKIQVFIFWVIIELIKQSLKRFQPKSLPSTPDESFLGWET